jgi:serine protease Do
LLQLDDQGNPICFSGSGSLVSPDGKILTNAHVVANDPACRYDLLGVAIIESTDEPPRLRYLADVVAFDEALDLAVTRIASDLDGNPAEPVDLPHVAIGDSAQVGLGDSLRILGFPGIGGDTITFTRGAVSGFVAERGVDDPRAWIKTDATIAGGNSGGMAVNDDGELVAIPTTAGAGEAAATDCRVIEDTNLDGFIDENDTCIPIGGFINGLRPVNLALTLLADADTGTPIQPVSPSIDPSTGFDVAGVEIHDVYFAPDVTADDRPTELVDALPSGVDQVCAFWSYSGMRDGVTYDAIWRIDGRPDADASFLDDAWAGGESGDWWVCAINDFGLTDGLYEFELTVEGEFLAAETIFVGGNRLPASLTVVNDSSDTICFVFISPTLSGYWGGDELGPTEVIEPSGTRIFDGLVTGRYDVSLRGCDLEVLSEWMGIELAREEFLTHVS